MEKTERPAPLRSASRVCALAACAVLIALGHSHTASTAPAPPPPEVRAALKPTGFEPAEATRDAGQFRLTITNSSGQGPLTFRLSKPGAQPLHASPPTGASAEWVHEFNLPAGRYVLTVADHPEWNFYVNLL
ncbi:MAG TPA: hypothetical protein VK421_02155 [Pyrinomonadaceae bacterium]|nr:hypothetical protein [Pyrinomonadaceae bacterium]